MQEPLFFYCTHITPYFFNPKAVEHNTDFVQRVLPFIENKKDVKLLYTEHDRKNFYYGDIVAQPDSVLTQKNHLISLEFKSLSGSHQKYHDKDTWIDQIRLKDVLQAVINAMQVSIVERKPCVALLRYVNVAYFIAPTEQLCKIILQKAPLAKQMYKESKYVSSSQLAELVEPIMKDIVNKSLRNLKIENEAQIKGQVAHETMLKR